MPDNTATTNNTDMNNPTEMKAPVDINDIPELPGIDVKAGLVSTRGKTALYRRLLLKFRDAYQDFEQQFHATQADGDFEARVRLAHSVKGAAGSLGMHNVQQAASALEQACAENADTIDDLLAEILDELQRVIDSVAIIDVSADA